MIHYFNPGHEMAVLNGSKFYRPAANVLKMQEDLASLPVWYANADDYVFCYCREESVIAGLTRNPLTTILSRKEITINDFLGIAGQARNDRLKEEMDGQARNDNKQMQNGEVDFWGISPQSIHFFEKLSKQHGLQLKIPEWKEEYRFLGSRFASQQALARLIDVVPEIEKNILPRFFSNLEEIERFVIESHEKQLVKSPYSSSGRGLVWLPPEKLAQSERQIISGMLKKQSRVSVEKALDKQLDFSMHFEIKPEGKTQFIGHSVFKTNAKGAYEKSFLANQSVLEKQITAFIDPDLLLEVRNVLTGILQEMYAPYYKGCIGVDMLVYPSENQFKLNPCVEINMRKSMGYVAIQLFNKYLCPAFEGEFSVDYHKNPGEMYRQHQKMQAEYPLVWEGKRIKSGYLALCPVTETSNYHAFIINQG